MTAANPTSKQTSSNEQLRLYEIVGYQLIDQSKTPAITTIDMPLLPLGFS